MYSWQAGKVMPRDDYLAKLDSLARFYNSQIIAHVGYTLTTLILFVTLYFGLLADIVSWQLPFGRIILFAVLLIAFILFPFLGKFWSGFDYLSRLTPLYHFARMKYYTALTEIVWDHMGLTRSGDTHFETLQTRAESLSILHAIMKLFEAWLYVSLRRSSNDPEFQLNKKELKSNEEEQANPESKSLDRQYEACTISVNSYLEKSPPKPIQVFSLKGYVEKGGTMGVSYHAWQTRLLLMAYRFKLREYSKIPEPRAEKGKRSLTDPRLLCLQVAELFRPYVSL